MQQYQIWEIKKNTPAGQVALVITNDGKAGKLNELTVTLHNEQAVYVDFPGQGETVIRAVDLKGYAYAPAAQWEIQLGRSLTVARGQAVQAEYQG